MYTILHHKMGRLFLLVLFCSCSTSRQGYRMYQQSVEQQVPLTLKQLEHNKWLNKGRNKMLLQLEAGLLARLEGKTELSNIYLNAADNSLGYQLPDVKGSLIANTFDPLHTIYRGTAYEQLLLHYYKALNYAEAGNIEDALVEAKRITLTEQRLENTKFIEGQTACRAFANNFQGMLYEMDNNMNDAFISYRAAISHYPKQPLLTNYANLPLQLLQDTKQAAAATGIHFMPAVIVPMPVANTSAGPELILFIEEGRAPVKEERDLFLHGNNDLGNYMYTDRDGIIRGLPANGMNGLQRNDISRFNEIKISLPFYRTVYNAPAVKTVRAGEQTFTPVVAHDLNAAALQYQKEHEVDEILRATIRFISKRAVRAVVQEAASASAKAVTNHNATDSTSEAKRKTEREKEAAGMAAKLVAGSVMSIVNNLTEKADTRSWYGLPAYISYVRIPLHEGENNIVVNCNGVQKTIRINSKDGLQMKAVRF